jgi:hypothetical protein
MILMLEKSAVKLLVSATTHFPFFAVKVCSDAKLILSVWVAKLQVSGCEWQNP